MVAAIAINKAFGKEKPSLIEMKAIKKDKENSFISIFNTNLMKKENKIEKRIVINNKKNGKISEILF